MKGLDNDPIFKARMDEVRAGARDVATQSLSLLATNELLQLADTIFDGGDLGAFCLPSNKTADQLLRILAYESVVAHYVDRVDQTAVD
jgi:hypothetical protein